MSEEDFRKLRSLIDNYLVIKNVLTRDKIYVHGVDISVKDIESKLKARARDLEKQIKAKLDEILAA